MEPYGPLSKVLCYIGNRVLFGTHSLVSRWPTAKFSQRRDKDTDEELLRFESKIIIFRRLVLSIRSTCSSCYLGMAVEINNNLSDSAKMIRVAEQALHIFLSLSYFKSQNRDIDHINNQNRPSGLPLSLAWGQCTPLFVLWLQSEHGKPFIMRVYVGTPDMLSLELQVSVLVRYWFESHSWHVITGTASLCIGKVLVRVPVLTCYHWNCKSVYW